MLANDKDFAKENDESQVKLVLRGVGNAPTLVEKARKMVLKRKNNLGALAKFLRTRLKIDPNESLILYINASFAPAQDAKVGELFDNFNSNGELIINYAIQEAWG